MTELSRQEKFRWIQTLPGYVILAAGILYGVYTIYCGSFCDEGDNIAVARFITLGLLPYRDIFSHHFPFTYYFLAGVFKLTGVSVISARSSVLLLEVIMFVFLMGVVKRNLALALAFLSFSVIAPGFSANSITYQRISGIMMFFVFAIVWHRLHSNRNISHALSIEVGAAASIALLSDPGMIFPIAIALIFFRLAGESYQRLFLISGIILGSMSIFGLFLWMTGSIEGFWIEAIRFNRYVYSRYLEMNLLDIKAFFHQFITGLEVFRAQWFTCDRSFHFFDGTPFDFSMFTGFFYRIGILWVVASLFICRKSKQALFVYLISCSLLMQAHFDFRIISLVRISLFLTWLLILGQIRIINQCPAISSQNNFSRSFLVLAKSIPVIGRIVMGSMIFILLGSMILLINSQKYRLSYDYNFGYYHTMAQKVDEISRSDPEVSFAAYPGGMHAYGFSSHPPLCRYIFLWPWVADFGLQEVIINLSRTEAVVYLPQDGFIWNRQFTQFLAYLYRYLDAHCVRIDDKYYHCRPCSIRSDELPPSYRYKKHPSRKHLQTLSKLSTDD